MVHRKQIRKVSGLFGWTGITFLSGFIVSLGVTYFFLTHTLRSVPFPSDWWFPPVNIAYIWFTFYLIKGLSAWMIWRKMGTVILGGPITWYVYHLIASVVATFLLFVLTVPLGFLVHSLIIAATFSVTSWKFFKKQSSAGIILIPNLVWLIYILCYYAVTFLNTIP